MYISESGAKYRKTRSDKKYRGDSETEKIYQSARKAVGGKVNGERGAKSKALEGAKKGRGIHEIGRGHGTVKGPVGY